jgi:hypothetical protein
VVEVEVDGMASDGVSYTIREVVLELNRRFDALDVKLDATLKDFGGFERRMALHEQLAGHPEGVHRLTAIEHDVRGLMANQQMRQAIEDYLKQSAQQAQVDQERRAAAWRWGIGLGVGAVLELGTLLLKVFGVL